MKRVFGNYGIYDIFVPFLQGDVGGDAPRCVLGGVGPDDLPILRKLVFQRLKFSKNKGCMSMCSQTPERVSMSFYTVALKTVLRPFLAIGGILKRIDSHQYLSISKLIDIYLFSWSFIDFLVVSINF